jgi:hypothetical protein
MTVAYSQSLELNIAPIKFSKDQFVLGTLPYNGHDAYRSLQDEHWRTHSFRYDNRSNVIYNVPIVPSVQPLGTPSTAPVQENLLLLARAVQSAILVWIQGVNTPILKSGKHLTFWGRTENAHLLSQALKKSNETPKPELEVTVKYEIDCRMFSALQQTAYLGMVIDLATSNLIEIPISELLTKHFPVVGRYVSRHRDFDHDYLRPKLEVVGRVQSIRGTRLILTDTDDVQEVEASEVFLEPRTENLEAVVKHLYPRVANAVLDELSRLRQEMGTAHKKRQLIQATIGVINLRELKIADELGFKIEPILKPQHQFFPESITVDRPNMLFGPQGRSSGIYPDVAINTHGPFMYMMHERNSPLIAVVCEKGERGRMEQFAESLRYGFDDKLWTNDKKNNPYPTGLISKYRLTKVDFEFEETADTSAAAYKAAIKRLLERTSRLPDLALVQIREEFRQRPTASNPYYVSKAEFMTAGVPTQDIRSENLRLPADSLAYLLNNISLAIYAKLDGTPWVIATHRPSTHELVVGLGSTEIYSKRVGTRKRYVGITTMFQGDGSYLVWGLTREVEFEQYAEALLASLQATVRYVQAQNAWQAGDKVRLVCHVYKRLKDSEVDAIKKLVRELIDQKFIVEFAFLDISEEHLYHLFDPNQPGAKYWKNRNQYVKGKGVPDRGICLQLDQRRALIHLTGAKELKTHYQGIPKPLLVELHPDSDFTDMTYLMRQVYHFTYMSWRDFFPATMPVTIKYSQLIANLLGNLNQVDGWTSTPLSVGSLRGRRWFL